MTKTNAYKTKVAIIGSGPAGCTAAIYAARAMQNPIIIRGNQPGGQLTITTDVENWPGQQKIQGPELTSILEQHAKEAGANILDAHIQSVEKRENHFLLKTESGENISAEAIILAMGSQAKWTGILGEEEYKGYGVSACATCDGFFFKNNTVSVIGGGNTALEEALFLTKFASHVHLIHRRDSFRAEKILQERVLSHPKIQVHWNTVVNEIQGQKNEFNVKSVTHLSIENTLNGQEQQIESQGVFIAIGHQPNSDIVQSMVQCDEHGYILTQGKTTQTSQPGIFAAGDIADPTYRQAITSAGTGCMAALDADHWLSSEKNKKDKGKV